MRRGTGPLRDHVARLILCALLAGCADDQAYRDGLALVNQGKTDEGMAKLKEATEKDPHDVEYRSAYLKAREHALSRAIEQADMLAVRGAFDEARKLYRHALEIDSGYERAFQGLTALDARIRQKAWLDDADLLLAKNQADAAGLKVAKVLSEAPNDPRALALKHSIDGKLAAGLPAAQLAQVYKKPITIEFKDVSLKQVFEVISHTSGLNFLFDKDVKTDQRTSIFLKNSTIEAAVRFVLLTNQLEQQIMDGNTILVYPNTPAKQKDYQELAVRTFYLANAEAKTVANTLKTILKSHDVAIDEKLNMIVVRDTPDAIRMAERLVAIEDVTEPEVMLDVEVLEVHRNRTTDLGLQWPAAVSLSPTPLGSVVGNSGSSSSGSTGNAGTYVPPGTSPSSTSNNSSLSLHDLAHQTLSSTAVSVGNATANANLMDTDAKLLSNPRIRVRNHEKAKVLIGNRLPNITSTATSTGFISQSINYIDVGLTLNVEPTIYPDNNVGIKLTLEVSSVQNTVTTSSGSSAYEIGTRTAVTSLRLKDGETDVMGGLITTTESMSGNKIPGLGDLPILGGLFGATTDEADRDEIVLAITPHLIRNVPQPDAADAMFSSGTENSLHGAGSGAGPVAPPTSSPSSSPSSSSSSSTSPTAPVGAKSPNDASSFGSGTNNGLGPNDGLGTDNDFNQNGVNGAGSSANQVASGDNVIAGGGAAGTGLAQLQFQGTNQVAIGGTVSLNLLVNASQPITTLPVTLSFDPSKLELSNITEGPFMRESGSPTSFVSRLSGSGQVTISDSIPSGGGATTQAVFATLTFKALAATTSSSVQLVSGAPTGVGNVPISLSPPAPFTVQITGQ
jgi:general secretion pathway protein D